MSNWEPVEGSGNYVHRTEWPEDYIRTLSEQEVSPYPDNLVVTCLESYGETNHGTFTFLPVLNELPQRVYCRAVKRSKSKPYKYEVEMDIQIENKPYTIVVENVPEEGIFLYEKAFAADWHLPNSFRHEIMIPDDIFPELWQNGPWTEDMRLYDPYAVPVDEDDVDGDDEDAFNDVMYDDDDDDDDAFV